MKNYKRDIIYVNQDAASLSFKEAVDKNGNSGYAIFCGVARISDIAANPAEAARKLSHRASQMETDWLIAQKRRAEEITPK